MVSLRVEKLRKVIIMTKRLGVQTVCLQSAPVIRSYAAVVGKKEGEGPLRDTFDAISDDSYFGEKTWEKAESAMSRSRSSVRPVSAALNAKFSASSVLPLP